MLPEVRPCREGDLQAITDLENWAIRETFAHFGETPITCEATQAAFAQARHPWLVAFVAGQFAGFARTGPWKAREAYRYSAEIGVYVVPEFQGQGIGRALYDVLFPMLKEMGIATVVAGITLPNEASVRLHESFGMAKIGTFPDVGFKFGEWHSVAYWTLSLALI